MATKKKPQFHRIRYKRVVHETVEFWVEASADYVAHDVVEAELEKIRSRFPGQDAVEILEAATHDGPYGRVYESRMRRSAGDWESE